MNGKGCAAGFDSDAASRAAGSEATTREEQSAMNKINATAQQAKQVL